MDPANRVPEFFRVGATAKENMRMDVITIEDPVLDVHRTEEFGASHLQGAVNIALHELPARIDEVPTGRGWVHCGSGYRSSVGASLLERAGRDVVQIDAMFADAAQEGRPMADGRV